MVVIENGVLKANHPYNFKLDSSMLTKTLSHHFFEQKLKRNPGKEDENEILIVNAHSSGSDVLREKDLEVKSRKIASALKMTGFQKGDTTLVMVHNNTEFYNTVFGTWFLGGRASVVSPILSPGHLARQLSAVKIGHIFCAPCSVEDVIKGIDIFNKESDIKANKEIQVIVMDNIDPASKTWMKFVETSSCCNITTYSEILEEFEPIPDCDCPNQFKEDDDCVIFWSSGTTGDPKGIILDVSYYMRLIVFEEAFFDWPNIKGEKYMITCNIFHGAGFGFCLISVLRNRHLCVIFTPKNLDASLDTEDIYRACHLYRPDLLMLGSHHAIKLGHIGPTSENLDLTSVRCIMPMGAPVHPSLPDEIRVNFPNFEYLKILYGMTETMLISTWKNPTALGELDIGVEARIVDSSSEELAVLGPNQVGEIQVKTPFMLKSYVDKRFNLKFFTKDGFARTGDLGHYNEDGILFFNGRLKDLIKYQGNHLYPKELESIIQKHPGVAEVVVFGLPDPEVMERVTALVVLQEGFILTEQDIQDCLVRAGVEEFKYIRGGVKFVKELPKNATGKIERIILPQFYNSV